MRRLALQDEVIAHIRVPAGVAAKCLRVTLQDTLLEVPPCPTAALTSARQTRTVKEPGQRPTDYPQLRSHWQSVVPPRMLLAMAHATGPAVNAHCEESPPQPSCSSAAGHTLARGLLAHEPNPERRKGSRPSE